MKRGESAASRRRCDVVEPYQSCPHSAVRYHIEPVVAVENVAIDDRVLYAGSDAGVYLSTDGGGSWDAENTGFRDDALTVRALAINPPRGRGSAKSP